MNPWIGWVLAAAALVIGWRMYGWQGALMALTVVVFWLLLQFSRVMRVMRQAGAAPLGRVASAVMFQARLSRGMTMLQVVPAAGSLGSKLSEQPDAWRWSDASGAHVDCVFEGGKLQQWQLVRPEAGPSGQQATP